MIAEWGIAAAALAFTVLAVFAVRLMHTARKSVLHAETTLQRLQERFDETAAQSMQLMRQSSELTRDMQKKLSQLDALFESVGELSSSVRHAGQTVRHMSEAVSQSVEHVQRTVHNNRDAIAEAVELTTAGYQLWQRWQTHRKPRQQSRKESTLQEGAE